MKIPTKYAILIIVLIISSALIICMTYDPVVSRNPALDKPVPEMIVTICTEYHGILCCKHDLDGQYYFRRDGQWCKVLTKGALKWYKEKLNNEDNNLIDTNLLYD